MNTARIKTDLLPLLNMEIPADSFDIGITHISEADSSHLHSDEIAWSERFPSEKRRREFIAGRALARDIIPGELLDNNTPLLPDSDRRPRWPETLHASISHSGDYVGCAYGLSTVFRFIGLDIQECRDTRQDLSRHIICNENEEIFVENDTSNRSLLTLFSVKEAAYKALSKDLSFTFMPRYIGLTPQGEGSFVISDIKGEPPKEHQKITIGSLTHEELIISLAIA